MQALAVVDDLDEPFDRVRGIGEILVITEIVELPRFGGRLAIGDSSRSGHPPFVVDG